MTRKIISIAVSSLFLSTVSIGQIDASQHSPEVSKAWVKFCQEDSRAPNYPQCQALRQHGSMQAHQRPQQQGEGMLSPEMADLVKKIGALNSKVDRFEIFMRLQSISGDVRVIARHFDLLTEMLGLTMPQEQAATDQAVTAPSAAE